jgi:hypothetical protein
MEEGSRKEEWATVLSLSNEQLSSYLEEQKRGRESFLDTAWRRGVQEGPCRAVHAWLLGISPIMC